MRPTHSLLFDFGGLTCVRTSPGSSEHVDFANLDKSAMYSFLLPSPRQLPCSRRSTSTPCIYPSPAVSDTSSKVDVRWSTTSSFACLGERLELLLEIGYSRIYCVNGAV